MSFSSLLQLSVPNQSSHAKSKFILRGISPACQQWGPTMRRSVTHKRVKTRGEKREKKLKFQKKQELLVLMMKPHISLRSPTNYLSNVVSKPNTLRMSLWLPVVASHMCEMASYASSNKRKSAEMEDTSLTLFSSSFRRGAKVATHRCVVVCDTLREGLNSNYKASSDCDWPVLLRFL